MANMTQMMTVYAKTNRALLPSKQTAAATTQEAPELAADSPQALTWTGWHATPPVVYDTPPALLRTVHRAQS